MSAIGYNGRALQILYQGSPIAACRNKAVQRTRTAIDGSDQDGDGWRRLYASAEVRETSITVTGVATSANFYWMLDEWLGNTLSDIGILHPDGSIELALDGAFMTGLQSDGDHDGYVSFSASFIMSGVVEEQPTILLTSRPYSLEILEALNIVPATGRGTFPPVLFESLDISGLTLDSSLRSILLSYENYQPEELDISGLTLNSTLRDALLSYDNYQPEALDISGLTLNSTLRDALLSYDNYQPEALDISGATLDSTLV